MGKLTELAKPRAWNSTLPPSRGLKRQSPRRVEREKVFRPYVAWIHGLGGVCVVCGETRNLQGSHVGEGGTGQKRGKACDMVRMCGLVGRRPGCHSEWGGYKGRFDGWSFDQRAQASIAWRRLHWEAFLDWVGVMTAPRFGNTECVAPDPALLDCEVEIRAALARLAPRWVAA